MGLRTEQTGRIHPDFSLRRYQPDQVQRVYLNSVQNTPKAIANVVFLVHLCRYMITGYIIENISK